MSVRIAILNLMPNKVETERHLKNKLCSLNQNTKLTFIKTASYKSKNTSSNHLNQYYRSLNDIKSEEFDAFICTGAPLEKLPFESVLYWKELQEILNWARMKTYSSYFICWGAQAALYHHYGIEKHLMGKKVSGLFNQKKMINKGLLIEKIPDDFLVPVSRYATTKESDLNKFKNLELILHSKDSGPCLVLDKNNNEFYNFNHFEYEFDTLKKEYFRDLKNNSRTPIPTNYFPNNDPNMVPIDSWKNDSSLFFNCWIDLISTLKRKQ